MKRSSFLVVGILTGALGALIWFTLERNADSQMPAASQAASASRVVEAPVAQPERTSTRTDQPSPISAADSEKSQKALIASEFADIQVPPDQMIARLRARSANGSMEAKVRLSERLVRCTERGLRGTREADERNSKSIEEDLANQEMDEDLRARRIEIVQRHIDQNIAERAACEALPTELVENWLDPVDEAAQFGIQYAMIRYADLVVSEYKTLDAVVADPDRAILRRDKARGYIRKVISLGNPTGLTALANAYFNNPVGFPHLYAVDNYQAYMYAYAASIGQPEIYKHLDWIMAISAESLDSHQISDAREQGKRLYDACCLNR